MTHKITLIPGDGIGPEVTGATKRIIESAGVDIQWDLCHAGAELCDKTGNPLPEETLDSIRKNRVALKGPTATPIGGGFSSVNVAMRKKLDLYANYRPALSFPGQSQRYKDVDIIVVRENTEGLYSGLEHTIIPGVVESLRIITEKGSERIVRFAFETAKKYGRKKVTLVHKANILKLSDGLFLETGRRVAREFPEIKCDDMIVDATCMKLVMDPHQFDVMVMENLFGDIVSDLCSGLIGGLGLAPSANIGKDIAVFEAVHGSAPDIAGKGVANPTAMLLSGVLMLRHIGEEKAADKIESAVKQIFSAGEVMPSDMGGKATLEEYSAEIIKKING